MIQTPGDRTSVEYKFDNMNEANCDIRESVSDMCNTGNVGVEKDKHEDKDSAAAAAAEKLPVAVHGTMRELSLRLISIEEGWFVIQRSAFDMTIGNEPYHALQILYQASTLRYLGRGFK